MPSHLIGLAGQTVSLAYPESIEETVAFLFGHHAVAGQRAQHVATISSADDGTFLLDSPLTGQSPPLKSVDLPEFVMDAVIRGLVTDQSDGVMLHAAALARQDKAVLIAGISGAGKSTLTAWLAHNGFRYLTDELVFLPSDNPLAISPFLRPLTLRADSIEALAADGAIEESRKRIVYGDKAVFAPSHDRLDQPPRPGAIIFPNFTRDAGLSIDPLSVSQSVLRLLENNLNGANLPDGGLATIARLANETPAFGLTYGDFDQLEGVLERVLDNMLNSGMDAKTWHQLHSAFGRSANRGDTASGSSDKQKAESTPAPVARTINSPTPSRGKFKLTIGMATYDDFDGVYFSIQSIRLNNPELMAEIEFLVIDNHPEGPCGDALKELENQCGTYRYVPFAGQSGTAVRDMVFSEANGEFVLCMDCHVLLAPGALARLLDFLDKNPDTNDLYQGPMIYDGLDHFSTHFEPVWRQGMYGVWETNESARDTDAEPFDIPMQGLGLFVSRRESWPGFNLKFHGFGGEEGYIHEKFRQRGGRTLCLPFLRWLHRFPRPMGVPYRLNWEDRIRNYTIGFRELGLNVEPIGAHFSTLLGEGATNRILTEIETELTNPFNRFDAIRYINLDDRADRRAAIKQRFEKLGIERLVSRFPAIKTPENHHIGCALSHRAIISDARQRGLKNVLVFEDDAIFHHEIMDILPTVLDEVENLEWDILFLGGHVWGQLFDRLPGSSVLRRAKAITACHALAFNNTVFDRVLEELPADHDAMARWLEVHHGIDQYFARLDIRKLLSEPMLSMQPELFDQPDIVDRKNFGN